MASPLEWITGVGGAVSGVVNGLFQHKQNKDNIKAQQEENEKNRQFNSAQAYLAYQRSVEQWKRENAYNTPAAQRGRLQAAGMNPDLAYDGASGAMASYADSSAASSSGGITPSSPVSFSEAFNNILQSRLLEAQVRNIDQNTEKQKSETDILSSDAKFRDAYNEGALKAQNVEIILNEKRGKLTDEQAAVQRGLLSQINESIGLIRNQSQEVLHHIANLKQDVLSKELDNILKSETMQHQIGIVANQYKLSEMQVSTYMKSFYADLALRYSQANANNASAKHSNALADTEDLLRGTKLSELGQKVRNSILNNEMLTLQLHDEKHFQTSLDNQFLVGDGLRIFKNTLRLLGTGFNGLIRIGK